MVNILVTGGLGFIGSHTCIALIEEGFNPIVVDNLSNSTLSVLTQMETISGKKIDFYEGDIGDADFVIGVLKTYSISAVIHFAAYKAVGESVEKPLKYYKNNVSALINLLDCMETIGVKNIVFSSSCTVYGSAKIIPVSEGSPFLPAESPYGLTKQIGEDVLKTLPSTNCVCLRYFNPVGAHPSSLIGELPVGVPSNLIPYLTQTLVGIRNSLTVFGNTYNTVDGSCVRDFIHVCDLAESHVAAVKKLVTYTNTRIFEVFNIGTGKGTSVLELIAAFEKVTLKKVPYQIGEKRAGDIAQIWADTTNAKNGLNWVAKRGLNEMLLDAWNWQLKLVE